MRRNASVETTVMCYNFERDLEIMRPGKRVPHPADFRAPSREERRIASMAAIKLKSVDRTAKQNARTTSRNRDWLRL
jgi:hypothetical protein